MELETAIAAHAAQSTAYSGSISALVSLFISLLVLVFAFGALRVFMQFLNTRNEGAMNDYMRSRARGGRL